MRVPYRLARLRYWPPGVYTDRLADRWHVAHPAQPTRELAVPGAIAPGGASLRIAVVVHVFYPDLLDELVPVLANLPPGADVYASVVDDAAARTVRERLAVLPIGVLDVRVVENRGRDIAPKYVAFADVHGLGHDLLLFLHTKKTTSEAVGPGWRTHLFSALAGSEDRVCGVLQLFRDDPSLGIVAPTHFGSITQNLGWHGSHPFAARIGARAGIAVHRWAPPDFASGSMFWARPAALAPLMAAGLRITDFPAEAGQNAYTVMHALERLTFLSARSAGYAIAVVAPQGHGDPVVDASADPGTDAQDGPSPGVRTRLEALGLAAAEIAREAALRRGKLHPGRALARLRARCTHGTSAD